jgi:hypothetical protein
MLMAYGVFACKNAIRTIEAPERSEITLYGNACVFLASESPPSKQISAKGPLLDASNGVICGTQVESLVLLCPNSDDRRKCLRVHTVVSDGGANPTIDSELHHWCEP